MSKGKTPLKGAAAKSPDPVFGGRRNQRELRRLFLLLREANKGDLNGWRPSDIRPRIAERMAKRKIRVMADYVAYAEKHPAELRSLRRDVEAEAARFFRDRTLYRALERSVFPKLLGTRAAAGALRAWVPGCATGEDAYSLAIALAEFLRKRGAAVPVQVFASDPSPAMIEKARTGIYPASIAAEVSRSRPERYFTVVRGEFKASRELREMCVFAPQTGAGAPFSNVGLIVCRRSPEPPMEVLHGALRPSGFLVLANGGIPAPSDRFTAVDAKNGIYRARTTADRELRECAEAIAAAMTEPVVVLDRARNVVAANKPSCKVFALDPAAARNAPFFELAGKAWKLGALGEAMGAMGTGDGSRHRLEIESVAGPKTLSINLGRFPVHGSPRLYILAVEEVSEQRVAQAAVHPAQTRFSQLTQEAPIGILQIDPMGDATFANLRACAIAGVEQGVMLGSGWLVNMYPQDAAALRSGLAGALPAGQSLYLEARFVRPGAEFCHAMIVATPLSGAAGKLTGYLVAMTDETARRELEDQLRHAQKMEAVGRLAGGVAHDFNNMLTAIGSYASELLVSVPEQSPAHALAIQIERVVNQAALATRQLLAFSRKQMVRLVPVRINTVLEDMRDLLVRLLGDQVQVVLDLAPDAGTVVVDPGQLQQIVLNLAINARDAMPEGGTMMLATSHVSIARNESKRQGLGPGEYVSMLVSDTGVGIDPEIRSRLFEPFITTKPPGMGTGLGLSMVYGIVRQSGGGIRVESESGRGTRFEILLPRAVEPEREPPAKMLRGEPQSGETVLLVEDSDLVRSLVREALRQHGYVVWEAHDAREALALAGKYNVDLLLTDVMMPGMGGHELARRLRRKRKKLKVIYMSGYVEGMQAVEKGSNFLEKPFLPDTLAGLVRKVLDEA